MQPVVWEVPQQDSSPSRSGEGEPCGRHGLNQQHRPSGTGWAGKGPGSRKGSDGTDAGSNESWQGTQSTAWFGGVTSPPLQHRTEKMPQK